MLGVDNGPTDTTKGFFIYLFFNLLFASYHCDVGDILLSNTALLKSPGGAGEVSTADGDIAKAGGAAAAN